MKSGAYDYLVKPFNLDELLIRVGKARERRHLALQLKNHEKDLEERLAQKEKELRAMTTRVIQALVQEELLAREKEFRLGKGRGVPPGTDIREFGKKILRRLRGA